MTSLLQKICVLVKLSQRLPATQPLPLTVMRPVSANIGTRANVNMAQTIYDFTVKGIKGEEVPLKKYKGKVCLIVNVASKCGLTKQYESLQKLYETHKSEGLEVLGFPCNQFNNQEPGTEAEIQSFCSLKYGVNFDMFSKIDVNGPTASHLYNFLKSKQHGFLTDAIKWNFTKFLVDRTGKPVKRYAPQVEPASLEDDIRQLLSKESKL